MNLRLSRLRVFLPLLGGTTFILGACGGDEPSGTPPAAVSRGGAAGASGAGGGAGASAGGSSAGRAGASGSAAGTTTGGSAGANGSKKPGAACAVDNDCSLAGIETQPPSCAEAFCDAGICALRSVDADGDTFRRKLCKLVSDGAFVITLGGDCDDANKDVNPKSWDGPAEGTKPDRCDDGVDQDCSGVDGDAITTTGGSCTCVPDDVGACAQTAQGVPITFPGGSPAPGSRCALGSRTCVKDPATGGGKWGPCINAVGPGQEVCNNEDDDCDGQTDEDDAQGKLEWVFDGDGDGYRATLTKAGQAAVPFVKLLACNKPTATPVECDSSYCGATPLATCCPPERWRVASSAPGDDCDDRDEKVSPAAAEVCATVVRDKDDNCNGSKDEKPAVGEQVFFRDQDGDGYGDLKTPGKQQCAPPGPEWKPNIPQTDCDDGKASVNPGVAQEDCATADDDNCNNTPKDGCGCTDADPKVDCGSPSACVFLPGDRACVGGVLAECSQPAIQAVEYCPDADNDTSCDLSKCGLYCPSIKGGSTRQTPPAGFRPRTECSLVSDCDDNAATRSPTKKEICGTFDGNVDTDCDGAVDNGYDIGLDCDVAGLKLGACLAGGKRACSGPESAGCAYAGPLSPPVSVRLNYPAANGSYDWSCDGKLVMALGIPSTTFGQPSCQSESFPAEHADGNFVVDLSPTPTGNMVKPAPWHGKDRLHPTPDKVLERVPSCGELAPEDCGKHYYFDDCREPAGSIFGSGYSCVNACGKRLSLLTCKLDANGVCAPPSGFPISCGAPYVSCY